MQGLALHAAFQRAIDGLPAHAAVLDESGSIIAVNEAWRRFGLENGLRDGSGGVGGSYLAVCEAPGASATEGPRVARAIRRTLEDGHSTFRVSYACHGPGRTSWFQVEVASLHRRGSPGALVTHVRVDEAFVRREIAEAERRHIARELHDTTAQNLASALFDLEHVAKDLRKTGGAGNPELDEAIALCQRSLGEVRSLAYEIAPPGFKAGRLVDSLKHLATTFARRTGFAVMLLASPFNIDEDDLSRESSEAIYRAAEESLHNARRHSGGKIVSVRIDRAEDGLRLEVKDDGQGMPPNVQPGKGLSDVQERLEACGGRLKISGAPGGTVVVAVVPAGGHGDVLDRNRR